MSSDRTIRRAALHAIVVAVLALNVGRVAAEPAPRIAHVDVDPARSLVEFRLGGSLHDTHGRFTVVRGAVDVDETTGQASGIVVVDAASGDSGNGSRDRRMKDVVLEAPKFPEITFRPERIAGRLGDDGSFQATVHGVLALHGAEHAVDLKARGRLDGGEMTASGRFVVPYVEWGMTDPSVLLLTVDKQVELDVTLVGRVRRGGAATAIQEGMR